MRKTTSPRFSRPPAGGRWGAAPAVVLVLCAVLLAAAPGVDAAEEAPVVQTMDLASARGSWLEATRADGVARALHFEKDCVVLEQLVDAEESRSVYLRSCSRQCLPQGFCAFLFEDENGASLRSLVLGGWVIDSGRIRMFGTLYLHGNAGQIVDGLPVAFVPPEQP